MQMSTGHLSTGSFITVVQNAFRLLESAVAKAVSLILQSRIGTLLQPQKGKRQKQQTHPIP